MASPLSDRGKVPILVLWPFIVSEASVAVQLLLRLDRLMFEHIHYASVNASIYTNESPLSLLTDAAYTPNV